MGCGWPVGESPKLVPTVVLSCCLVLFRQSSILSLLWVEFSIDRGPGRDLNFLSMDRRGLYFENYPPITSTACISTDVSRVVVLVISVDG